MGAALCAGLVGGLVSPAWAAAPPDGGSGDVQLGSFALGDALEGTIGELDGAFGFTVAAGGIQLAWDSRAAATDAVQLGKGWSFGLTTLRVTGGVWAYPPSGGAYPMSASSPSGLAGYPGTDVKFAAAEPGAVVPARADGSVPETPYAYVLHELGGASTYFDADGFPIAKLVEGGERLDWRWETGGSGRLLGVVSPDGSVTSLDWSDPSRVVIQPGSNVTDAVEGSGAGGRWEIGLEGGRVSTVSGPAGGSTRIAYDQAGLVERVSTPSGSSTVVQWQASTDGVARVERVRLLDESSGAVLSVREWGVRGGAVPSGWPYVDEAAGADASAPAYETWLSDGKTRVDSAVDAQQRLTERAVAVAATSGERVLQEQSFEYPQHDGPAGAPVAGAKPISATTTHHDADGATRSASETYGFDTFGRMVERTTTEGATIRRTYDDQVPTDRPLPIGLVTEETTTTADGLVSSTRSELSEDRASVVATEQWSARDGGELTRVSRVESDIDHGVLTEERVFPGGDPAAVPVVTRWSTQVDLPHGTKTVVQTAAVGTPIETSTTAVSSLVHGGVLSATDEVGNVTTARFDAAGREVAAVDAAGRTVEREYRSKQVDGVNGVRIATGTGVVVTETQDVLGRVVQKADNVAPSGRAEAGHERVFASYDYETLGVERVTDAWGATTTTTRDVFGRTERVDLPNGLVQLAEFDDVNGTATSGVSLTGDLADAEVTTTVTRAPDGSQMTTTGTRADGVAVPNASTEFDGLGRTAVSTTGERRTETEYDVRGNAVATNVTATEDAAVSPGGELTSERRFDAFGVSVEKTMRSGDEVYEGQQRELDELGRVVSETDQRGVTERTSYTPDGLVAEVVSDTGRVESFEYDPVTRDLVTSRVSSPNGADVATSYRYDQSGALIAVFDPADEANTTIRYESDDFGNRTLTAYPDGSEIRHEFDQHGRKIATVDVDGNRTAYTYDEADGSLIAAAMTDREGAPIGGVTYGYDELARVSSIERENGVRTDYTFTSTAQIETEITTGPEGVLTEREYTYAPTGTLTSRVDRVRNDAGQLEASRTEYEYDLRERLIRSTVRESDAPESRVVTLTEYEPTVGGDLASETVTTDPGTPEAVTSTRRFEYSDVGELLAIETDGDRRSQQFDADGSLVAPGAGGRYEYDAASRPVAQTTTDGVHIATTYWADGSRREHTTQAGATRFYWDGGRLLNDVHETTAGEYGTASYLIGTSRQARITHPEGGPSTTSYYGTDRHGNITELIDDEGAITTWYRYTDYGVPTRTGEQSTPLPGGIGELGYNPFQYAGEYTYRDGTQPLGPRTYDPKQVRFLTEDKAPLANLYAFGDLNPITNVDPSGRQSMIDTLRIGAVGLGFAFAVVGALAFAASGPFALSGVGMLTGILAGGDVAIGGLEIAVALGKVRFEDPRVLEIASWTTAALSLGLGIGGIVTKVVKSRAATKVGSVEEIGAEIVDDTVNRDALKTTIGYRTGVLKGFNEEELEDLANGLTNQEVKALLETSVSTYEKHVFRLMTDNTRVEKMAYAPTVTAEAGAQVLARHDGKLVQFATRVRDDLQAAENLMTTVNSGASTGGKYGGLIKTISKNRQIMDDALDPAAVQRAVAEAAPPATGVGTPARRPSEPESLLGAGSDTPTTYDF